MRPFDFIFEEYRTDPSLPEKLIPSINDLTMAFYPNLRFICRNGRHYAGLNMARYTVNVKGRTLVNHYPDYAAFSQQWEYEDNA